MDKAALQKTLHYILLTLLGLLTIFLVSELAFSLKWRMEHDTPILHYIAFLIDKYNFVPYKDIFEQSMPGTYLFHLAIGKTLGYGDLSFQIANVLYFLLTFGSAWLLMKPFGGKVALASVLSFGLLYFSFGPTMILQRDYVGILPIVLALILATRNTGALRPAFKMLAIGALFGLAAAVKPHLGIGLLVIFVYLASNHWAGSLVPFLVALLRDALFIGLGFIFTFSIPFLWVLAQGSLPAFWQIFSSYLSLYLHVGGDHVVLTGPQRWLYLLKSYFQFGGQPVLVIFSILGIYFFLSSRVVRRTALNGTSSGEEKPRLVDFFQKIWRDVASKDICLLAALLLVYSVYPVFSGKFWPYHWMPFYFFACLCISLLLAPISLVVNSKSLLAFGLFLAFALITIRPAPDFAVQISGQPPKALERVDIVAAFLAKRLQPGDRVQPLDVVNGDVLQGLLVSRAVIATPYIYDYEFYHDVSNPYIQALRQDFMYKLTQARPRFIIEYTERLRPVGADTSATFPELTSFIEKEYEVRLFNKKIRIYERR
jgi:hypothetical protein